MSEIDDVRVCLSIDDREQDPLSNGSIGELYPHQGVVILACVDSPNIFGVTVDGQKNVIPKKNWNENGELPRMYKASVPIKVDLKDIPYSEYPGCHFRLLQFNSDGSLWIWEIALISQSGEFFLSVQNTYQIRCYQDSVGNIIWPQLEDWDQMRIVVEGLWRESFLSPHFVEKIPSIKTYCSSVSALTQGISENTALVLWYNRAQQFGCLLLGDGREARVHWSEIRERKPAYLKSMELVRYEGLVSPRETKNRLTSFDWEVVGVTPLSS